MFRITEALLIGLIGPFAISNIIYGVTNMAVDAQNPPAKIFVQTTEPEKPSLFKFKETKDAITDTIRKFSYEINPLYKIEAALNSENKEQEMFRNMFTLAATKYLGELQKTHNFMYTIEFEPKFNEPQYFPLTTGTVHAKYFDQGGEIAWTFRVVFEPGVDPSFFQGYPEATSKPE